MNALSCCTKNMPCLIQRRNIAMFRKHELLASRGRTVYWQVGKLEHY